MSSYRNTDELLQCYTELVRQLSLDESAGEVAWRNYCDANETYTLEGESMHWIACSLYSACRTLPAPNLERLDSIVEGNCASLTKLARLCNVSLSKFFDKIQKWMDMVAVNEEFPKTISRLKSNFSVSMLLFQKFKPIFTYVFQPLEAETTKTVNKIGKKRSSLCSLNNFFEFCWCLFICAKGELPELSDDLVFMYHALLSCMDYMFANAYLSMRKDLINPSFEGLPDSWLNTKTRPKNPPCIIELMCRVFQGSDVEAKAFKEYNWKEIIKKLFENTGLIGENDMTMGLLDTGNFYTNLKSLNKHYGMTMLKVGDFDERIFLGNISSELGANVNGDEIVEALTKFGKEMTFVQETPLTGRRHLVKHADPDTPISMTAQSLVRLHRFLAGCSNAPSQSLLTMFSKCKKNPLEDILNLKRKMSTSFLTAYAPFTSEEIAGSRLLLIEALYYKLLEENILEEQRRKINLNLEGLLNQEILHQALFACCCQIIIFHHYQHTVRFPWILECLRLPPFHFYKIIELVVLCIKEKLSRDVIKHLNSIEEQVLESQAWTLESPLWKRIADLGEPIPQWYDVCIQENNNLIPAAQSAERLQSATVSSVSDCFLSPKIDVSKRQLFVDPIKPGQSLLNQNASQLKLNEASTSNFGIRRQATSQSRPVKGGSLGLFFRKFYYLAATKMTFFCDNLKLEDSELKQKIWTCFEQTIVKHTSLMENRHLDQILMCTIYAICKASTDINNRTERKFTDIMRCYRMQPQASNHVYRSVHVPTTPNIENEGENGKLKHNGRIDLIEFYNFFYVPVCRSLVNGFCRTQSNEDYTLSLIPKRPVNGNSGVIHRLSDNYRICIKPLTENSEKLEKSSKTQATYTFSRSQTKDLHEINALVCKEIVIGKKRPIHQTHNEVEPKRRVVDGEDNETENTNSM